MASLDGVQHHERFGELIPAVFTRAYLAACHAELGTFAAGRSVGDEGLQIAEAVDHPASRMFALWGSGLLALRQGDLSRTLPLLERAVRIADAVLLLTQAMEQTMATEMVINQALCRLALGEAQLLAGRLEEVHALAAELGLRPLVAHCHLGLGRLYGLTGRGEQTSTTLATAIDLYRAMDMTFWLPQAEAALVQIGQGKTPAV
jgi:hypothetical protein